MEKFIDWLLFPFSVVRTLWNMPDGWIALLILFAILWIVFAPSVLVGWAAGQRGGSRLLWFLLSMSMTPIFAVLALIAVGTRVREDSPAGAAEADHRYRSSLAPSPAENFLATGREPRMSKDRSD